MKTWRLKFSKDALCDERGSLSVLIIGLFLLTVALLMVMTDISSLVLSRKALTQQTEFLAQQGAKEIDLESYYQGRGGLLPYLAEKTLFNQTDPGIPLDCAKSTSAVQSAAANISHERFRNFELIAYQCKGDMTYIETKAEAVLPYTLSFLHLDNPEIRGYAASAPERRNGFWIKGFRLW